MLEATKATPIVPWIGGKRRLAKHILPLFPEHACYVEPSCGVAALYFLKAPAKVEVINDINGELVNLCRIVRHHHHHPQSGWGFTAWGNRTLSADPKWSFVHRVRILYILMDAIQAGLRWATN